MTMHKFAYETMLMNTEFLSQSMLYFNLVMAWMVRVADPKKKHPWETVELPLPKEVPETFAMLPEWMVEDTVEFFIFLGK